MTPSPKIDRSLGPGGGSIISKANGTSSYNYNMNAAYFPRSSTGTDGLIVRVGNAPHYGPTGLAAVRRLNTTANSSGIQFEHLDDGRMIIKCASIGGK